MEIIRKSKNETNKYINKKLFLTVSCCLFGIETKWLCVCCEYVCPIVQVVYFEPVLALCFDGGDNVIDAEVLVASDQERVFMLVSGGLGRVHG